MDNRTISKQYGKFTTTPYELWFKHKPNIKHLRTFGCAVQIVICKSQRGGNFEEITNDGILIGFIDHNHNYKVYNFDSDKVKIVHDVVFLKNIFPYQKQTKEKTFEEEDPKRHQKEHIDRIYPSQKTTTDDDEDELITEIPQGVQYEEGLTNLPNATTSTNNISNEGVTNPRPATHISPPEPRRSARERHAPDFYKPSSSCSIYRHSSRYTQRLIKTGKSELTYWNNSSAFTSAELNDCYAFSTGPTAHLIDKPKTFAQAMKSPHKAEWKAACDKEIQSITNKGVWRVVPRPKHKAVIKGRWVFKVKAREDGGILKFKSRYVAKGFSQVEGIDYFETFSPTGKPSSFRVLVAIAAANGWEIEQMDAIGAFLNSECKGELYLELPYGYKEDGDMVARLDKTLYGLKQSAREWSNDVCEFLVSEGFAVSPADQCIYTQSSSDGKSFSAVYVHVDDMAITGNEIKSVKSQISSRW